MGGETELLGTVLRCLVEMSSKLAQREQSSSTVCWDDFLKWPLRWPKGSKALRQCVGMTLWKDLQGGPWQVRSSAMNYMCSWGTVFSQVKGHPWGTWIHTSMTQIYLWDWPRGYHVCAALCWQHWHFLVEAGPPSSSCIFGPAYSTAFSPLSCQLPPAGSWTSFQMPGWSPRSSTASL